MIMKRHLISAMAALCILGAADVAAQGPRHHHGRYGESGVELSVGYLHSGYKHKEWVSEEVERDRCYKGFYHCKKNTLFPDRSNIRIPECFKPILRDRHQPCQ